MLLLRKIPILILIILPEDPYPYTYYTAPTADTESDRYTDLGANTDETPTSVFLNQHSNLSLRLGSTGA